MTPFETRCAILAEIWMEYRDDVNYKDLFNYGDLAFPLAYLLDNDYVTEATDGAKGFIDEVFELLLSSLGIEGDTGFEDADDILLSDDEGEFSYFDAWEEEEEDEEEEDGDEDTAK